MIKYCPQCKYPLRRIKINKRRRLVCQKCGWINYENPLPAVVAVVRNNKKILLVRRGIKPHKGRWSLPSGFIEIEETPQVACLRELKEETNLEGKISGLIGIYGQRSKMYRNVLVVAYKVEVKEKKELVAGDDAQEARFFFVSNLPHIPFSSHLQIMKDLKL
jgi:ADP-ribose pyrophosphatase YjhB (NUDIX family)